MKVSKSNRRVLIDNILKLPNVFGRYSEYEGLLTFLEKIWDLRAMPSTDPRYKTALEDIRQHMVNNNDWSIGELFYDRLKVLESTDKIFIKLIDTWISPEVRYDKEEIVRFVAIINSALADTPVKLVLSDYFEGLPVYRLKDADKYNDLPLDIVENTIPFYKEVSKIKMYPCFVLRYDKWDDYHYKTTFHLYYYGKDREQSAIGTVKILHNTEKETWDVLKDEFYSLDGEYCSLGQVDTYYLKLKTLLGLNFQSVALALRDCALFPKIQDKFENHEGFKSSLLRNDDADKVLRTIRYILNGLNLKDCFKFSFTFKPQYADSNINLNFDFDYTSEFPNRVYALIGKNGTGKTSLLAALASELRKNDTPIILPRNPLHAKVFTVSYSFFDRFDIPDSDVAFNYVYCGLRRREGGFLSQEDLLTRLYAAANKIRDRKFVKEWYLTLHDFVSEDLLEIAFNITYYRGKVGSVELKEDGLPSFFNKLSSGQNILVFVISEILSLIRPYSLILYDEPETHLHPNAISSLMATIFNLVRRFESFCIIATHSPIIVQELPSRCIYVLDRENENITLRTLERESFGENLTIITEEIFGNIEVPKHYQTLLEELVNSGKKYSEIMSLLANENLPITLNTRLYVKALLKQQ